MSDPSGDDELRVAKRLLEAELSARGISGIDLDDGRVRELWAASGREFRLLVDVLRALQAPGDLLLPSTLDGLSEAPDGPPQDSFPMHDDPVRRLVLANLARLGPALPPEPEVPPAGLDRLLPRLDEIIARAQARLGGTEG
jgi:hypothetical protein